MGSIVEELVCNAVVQPETDMSGDGEDVDYCLNFSDIVGDDQGAAGEEDSVGASEADVDIEQHDHEILKLRLSYCKPEIPEFCVLDGFNLYKGCKEELPQEGSKHTASLLRLNYDDILSSWCDDRSLWTDGKRPQTVPEDLTFADPGPSVVRCSFYILFPDLQCVSDAKALAVRRLRFPNASHVTVVCTEVDDVS